MEEAVKLLIIDSDMVRYGARVPTNLTEQEHNVLLLVLSSMDMGCTSLGPEPG